MWIWWYSFVYLTFFHFASNFIVISLYLSLSPFSSYSFLPFESVSQWKALHIFHFGFYSLVVVFRCCVARFSQNQTNFHQSFSTQIGTTHILDYLCSFCCYYIDVCVCVCLSLTCVCMYSHYFSIFSLSIFKNWLLVHSVRLPLLLLLVIVLFDCWIVDSSFFWLGKNLTG